MNKKIKNANPFSEDGILFKSMFELHAYQKMKELGFSPVYEPEKIQILHSFELNKPYYVNGEPVVNQNGNPKKIRAWSYSPDFRIEHNGKVPNDVYAYKRKMFLKLINDKQNWFFCEVYKMPGLINTLNKIKDGSIG